MQHFEQMAEIVAKSGAKFEMRDLKCEHFIALSIFFEHVENFGWLTFLWNFQVKQYFYIIIYVLESGWLCVCFGISQFSSWIIFLIFLIIYRGFCIILFGGC
eukprot:TRINITY_DN3202_c1_g1_i4.p5 TRINITY_DN3202_c1_g1~~TRINITY_DN3202_c1_g1_i4.p5  ORF type:complete len:102 (+),score=5.45 TRINITY_DN3202_c1_g1_i4:593-898(+)